MKHIEQSALVAYPADKMFHLVDDVNAYPEFLPWCGGAEILQRKGNRVQASIRIHYLAVDQTFTTENTLTEGREIKIRLLRGPFSHLQGDWRFQPLSAEASKVSLRLDFDFSSKVIALVVSPVFSQIANSLVQAFCHRAKEMYGTTGVATQKL
ncbi:MAG TPA: type II toxin-antitoxin system RatA family toxin [Gammaproteobacteria bacterium]|nr:type II toxin-antitoxin system RatA family toxin [Gammaproteobacteria bacterium]